VINLVWPIIAGYLIGSIPTAYLAVRLKSRKDIRTLGSGNVGTLNSYQVTGSKAVGLIVLVVDILKGIAAVMVGQALVPPLPFVGASFAGFAAVTGHSYPVWLRFRGGRGLATAAGAMGILSPPLVGAWMALWGIGHALVREVNVASAVACVLLGAALMAVPDGTIRTILPAGATTPGFRVYGVLLLVVMLSRLVGPLREYLRDRRNAQVSERGESK
jgi:glycerol-3-phosphate acyltransferase PlsY